MPVFARVSALAGLMLIAVAVTAQDASTRDRMRSTATILGHQGRYLDAQELLTKLIQSDPKDIESWGTLAELDFRFGYYDTALAALNKFLELRSGDQHARVLKAVCLFKSGEGVEAVSLTRQLLAEKPPPNDVDLTLTYAQYLYEHGDLEDALAQARNATVFAPQHPIAFFWLARLLLDKGQIADAARAAEQSVGLGSQLPYARNLLVRIYRLQGRTDDAERQADWIRAFEARKASP
jgi:tetratricopeptide (TPR) repeat protein